MTRLVDPQQLAVSRTTRLLKFSAGEIFERSVRIASAALGTGVATVSLLDSKGEVYRFQTGLEGDPHELPEWIVDLSLATIQQEAPIALNDIQGETESVWGDRASDIPFRAFLTVPVFGDDMRLPPVGSLCVMTPQPREWNESDISLLRDIAWGVHQELKLRSQQHTLTDSQIEALRYAEIVNRSEDLVAMTSTGGVTFLINDALRTFVGISVTDDPTGYTLEAFFDPKTYARLRDKVIPTVIESGSWSGELRWLSASKDRVLMSVNILCHTAPHDEVKAISIVARDISLQVARQKVLKEEKREAESESQAKSTFLANMSHELRTPLNAVLGFSELLGDIVTTEKGQHYLSAIHSSGEALLDVINDILDLSKIESGRLPLELEPVSLKMLLKGMVLMFSAGAQQKGLELITEFTNHLPNATSEDADVAVVIDPHRFRQILFNLANNAIKFTSEGRITISIVVEPSESDSGRADLTTSVIDTGLGIPESQLQQIFRPFEQGDAASMSDEAGTGLGLTICRRLARLMNGDIHVESQPNQGSTFRVELGELELAEIPPLINEAEERTVQFDSLRRSRILAVDDHAFNREVIAGIFEGTHHEVHLAKNGYEALQQARELKPDVILMDIRMPQMDGNEANEAIKSDPELSGIPVIAVTASSMRHEAEKFRRRFDGYVRKPFSRRQLFSTLETYLSDEQAILAETVHAVPPLTHSSDPDPAEASLSNDDLHEKLDQLEVEVLPELRKTIAINRVVNLAQSLQTLGQSARRNALMAYALHLGNASAKFQANRIESLLRTGWDEMRETLKGE